MRGFAAILLLAAGALLTHGVAASEPERPLILTTVDLEALQRSRQLRIYVPPSYRQADNTQRYPVIYLHDGQNLFDAATSFAGEWAVDESLDALAREGLEVIAVGIDNGAELRINELKPYDHPKYGKGEARAYIHAIIHSVKPYIDANFRTLTGPEHTVIMGSSLGGLTSHIAALEHPDVFGRAGIFSPAYWIAEPTFRLTTEQPFGPKQRLYFLMGAAEGDDMVEKFTQMQAIVQNQPVTSKFLLAADGEHNESFWRNHVADAIAWLLQPPVKANN